MQKSVLLFTLVLIVLMIVVNSCSAKFEYMVLEIGPFDHYSMANHNTEYQLSMQEYNNIFASRNRSIEYLGERYESTYENSRKDYLYKSDWDFYICDSDGTISEFAINRSTNEIDYYYTAINPEITEQNELTEDECLRIASEYLSKRVDVTEYRVTCTEDTIFHNSYEFTFIRYIDDFATCDSARIRVCKNGTVTHHYYDCIGEMKYATLPSQEDLIRIQEALDQKIAEIYEDISLNYSITYELKNELFVRLENGRYAIRFSYDVTLSSKDTTDYSYSELTQLIVYT